MKFYPDLSIFNFSSPEGVVLTPLLCWVVALAEMYQYTNLDSDRSNKTWDEQVDSEGWMWMC